LQYAGEYRSVWKQGIDIHPQAWHDIYIQFTDLNMELSEPEDCMFTLKQIIEMAMKKYPEAFQEAFYPLTQPVAIAPTKQERAKIVTTKPSVQKAPKSNEDTSWHQLKKATKKTDLTNKEWISKNL
jgi:hypothetical protein